MLEVELKFPIPDPAAIERRLADLGAVAEPTQRQSDLYLAHPCRNFAETDEALRIRTTDSGCVVTYKGPAHEAGVKTRLEHELSLPQPDRTGLIELFRFLSFQPVLEYAKTRRPFSLTWHGRELHLALDDIPPLGTYLEIELLAEEDQAEGAQSAVRELAGHLGLDAEEKKTYLEMMLDAARTGRIERPEPF